MKRRGHLRRRYGRAARVPAWANFETSLIGARVELRPHLDRWMMGDRYGTIVGFGKARRVVKVDLDRSGQTLKFSLDNLKVLG